MSERNLLLDAETEHLARLGRAVIDVMARKPPMDDTQRQGWNACMGAIWEAEHAQS